MHRGPLCCAQEPPQTTINIEDEEKCEATEKPKTSEEEQYNSDDEPEIEVSEYYINGIIYYKDENSNKIFDENGELFGTIEDYPEDKQQNNKEPCYY